jgi:aminotransferase
MALSLSKRADGIVQAEIRVMTIECEKVSGINLAQGVCDGGVPKPVAHGAKIAIDDGINCYTRYDGLVELRRAIADKMRTFNKIEADPETEVTVSAGSTGAFYCACLALLDPGDEVILFEPFYGYHLNTILAVDVVPKYVPLSLPDLRFTMEDLEKAVTLKTKGIMVCTPANPSGKVFNRSELEVIAGFVLKYDLFVFTDEIYEHFVYDGSKHIAPATLPGMKERTVTISGLSKTFSITGWRIGYCICDALWTKTIGFFSDLVYVCAPAPLQVGVAKGLMALGPEYYQKISQEYKGKRDRLCNALFKAGLEPYIPRGAYYILADISRLPGATSKERAMYLLGKTKVACVPGEAFYHDEGGENLARFCFAKEDHILDEACRRLERLKV